MARLLLITGFLGSGKTTFLKKLIAHLAPARLCVIVNEFGLEGVDGSLIAQLGVAVNEINNGSIFCTCRADQFMDALRRAAGEAPDWILIEASGLSDPTSIQAVLASSEEYQSIEYAGSICVVDALRFEKIFTMVRVCREQVAIADLVLVNKAELASPETLERVALLVAGENPLTRCHATSYGSFEPEWIETLRAQDHGAEGRIHLKDVGLKKALIALSPQVTLPRLRLMLKQAVSETFRLKGFVQLEGMTYLVDCVGDTVSVAPYAGPVNALNHLVALAGQGMAMKPNLKRVMAEFPDCIAAIE